MKVEKETIELMEENLSDHLYNFEDGKIFLNRMHKDFV